MVTMASLTVLAYQTANGVQPLSPTSLREWAEIPALAIILGLFVYMGVYIIKVIPNVVQQLTATMASYQNELTALMKEMTSQAREQHALFQQVLIANSKTVELGFAAHNTVMERLINSTDRMTQLLVEVKTVLELTDRRA